MVTPVWCADDSISCFVRFVSFSCTVAKSVLPQTAPSILSMPICFSPCCIFMRFGFFDKNESSIWLCDVWKKNPFGIDHYGALANRMRQSTIWKFISRTYCVFVSEAPINSAARLDRLNTKSLPLGRCETRTETVNRKPTTGRALNRY